MCVSFCLEFRYASSFVIFLVSFLLRFFRFVFFEFRFFKFRFASIFFSSFVFFSLRFPSSFVSLWTDPLHTRRKGKKGMDTD